MKRLRKYSLRFNVLDAAQAWRAAFADKCTASFNEEAKYWIFNPSLCERKSREAGAAPSHARNTRTFKRHTLTHQPDTPTPT